MTKPSASPGLVLSSAAGRPYLTQIRDQLLARIRSGELQPGTRLASMRQMAASCGVSLGIVKQAVNLLCAEGHLRSHPGSGVFVAEAKTDWRMVSLVVPGIDDYEMPRIIRGVKAGLSGTDRRLMIQAADHDFAQEMELLALLDPQHISGAIIYPPPLATQSGPLRALAQRLPVVLVNTILDGLDLDGVEGDQVVMGRTAVALLLDQGHRRIGVIDHSGDSLSDRELRLGADEALGRQGLRFADLARVVTDVSDLDPVQPWANGERAGLELLRDHPGLTAVIGMNNNLSLGMFRAARAAGRRIPQELALVSIGDNLALGSVEPGVTAVTADYESLGRRAALRLAARLAGDRGLPRIERLAPVVHLRGSVAALR